MVNIISVGIKSIKQSLFNLYFRLYFSKSDKVDGPIFIIGTGRSGTHFLCSCLNLFPSLDDGFDGKESKYIFNYLSDLTVKGRPLPKSVIGYYRYMKKAVAPSVFLDQSHPNIWHVESLLASFPTAKFIALSRDVYSVVYSMKNHEGVAAWEKNHELYPKPNRFLGITKENEHAYSENLTDIQRYVFRWCSHEDRIAELKENFPNQVLHVKYEDLARDIKGQMSRIADFIMVAPPTKFSNFKEDSLHKKDNLSGDEVREIGAALNMYDFDDRGFLRE